MSIGTHNRKSSKSGHGSAKSYVVGLVLSLVFTIIPYYMVVNKTSSGNTLLAIILGFAVLQMLIQIFFFLHLGRGPKPLYNVVFFFATAGMIVVVIVASLLIMSNLYRNMSPEDVIRRIAQKEGISRIGDKDTGACQMNKESHIVTIANGKVSPLFTEAKRCDTLTFVNEDTEIREMAFGGHPNHDGYGGEDEIIVKKGRPETITLNEVGNFIFHDHLVPTVTGHLIVSQ